MHRLYKALKEKEWHFMTFIMKATHTVQKIAEGASLNDARARPKSHIFSLQSALASIFFGFKSR